MPRYRVTAPDGRQYQVTAPEGVDEEELRAYLTSEFAKMPKAGSRTAGEAVSDVGASLVSGAGSLVQLPGQLYGLATGDFSDTGALGAGKRLQEAGEKMKSRGLKEREQARAGKIQEAGKKGELSAGWAAFTETLKDPGLLVSFLAEQAPQLAVPFGAAKVATGAAMLKGAGKLSAEAAKLAAAKIGASAAVGAGAVQQGADIGAGTYEAVYKELTKNQKVDPKTAAESALNLARASGASGAVISLLAQRLPGARLLEETIAGVPGKAGAGRLATGIATGLGESYSETAEEVGGRLAQNLAMRDVKPDQSLTEGLGETGGMAALGGAGVGSIVGALGHRPAPPVKQEEKKPEPTAFELWQKARMGPDLPPEVQAFQQADAERAAASMGPFPLTPEAPRQAPGAPPPAGPLPRIPGLTPEQEAQLQAQQNGGVPILYGPDGQPLPSGLPALFERPEGGPNEAPREAPGAAPVETTPLPTLARPSAPKAPKAPASSLPGLVPAGEIDMFGVRPDTPETPDMGPVPPGEPVVDNPSMLRRSEQLFQAYEQAYMAGDWYNARRIEEQGDREIGPFWRGELETRVPKGQRKLNLREQKAAVEPKAPKAAKVAPVTPVAEPAPVTAAEPPPVDNEGLTAETLGAGTYGWTKTKAGKKFIANLAQMDPNAADELRASIEDQIAKQAEGKVTSNNHQLAILNATYPPTESASAETGAGAGESGLGVHDLESGDADTGGAGAPVGDRLGDAGLPAGADTGAEGQLALALDEPAAEDASVPEDEPAPEGPDRIGAVDDAAPGTAQALINAVENAKTDQGYNDAIKRLTAAHMNSHGQNELLEKYIEQEWNNPGFAKGYRDAERALRKPKFGVDEAPAGEHYTADELTQELAEFMGVDALGPRITIVDSFEDLPARMKREVKGLKGSDRAFGWTNDFRAVLIADRIRQGEGRAKFMHEVGSHLGVENLLSPDQLARLVNRVYLWAKQDGTSAEHYFARRAVERMRKAVIPDEDVDTELLAYFIEEAVLAGVDPTATNKMTGPLREWFRSLWASFKRAIRKLGINADAMTAKDVVNIAYGAARLEVAGTWHGTAGEFRRFDHGYMGEGEGTGNAGEDRSNTGAFAWGTYLAQKYGIAHGYYKNDKLKKMQLIAHVDGASYKDAAKFIHALEARGVDQETAEIAQNALEESAGKVDVALDSLIDYLEKAVDYASTPDEHAFVGKMQQAIGAIQDHVEVKRDPNSSRGSLMRVDVNAKDSELLDWDAPISEQSTLVRNALGDQTPEWVTLNDGTLVYGNSHIETRRNPLTGAITYSLYRDYGFTKSSKNLEQLKEIAERNHRPPTGQQIYEALQEKLGSKQRASEYLDSLGIKGVRFFDQTSRVDNKNRLGDYPYRRRIKSAIDAKTMQGFASADQFIEDTVNDIQHVRSATQKKIMEDENFSPKLVDEFLKLFDWLAQPRADSTRNIVVFNDKNIQRVASYVGAQRTHVKFGGDASRAGWTNARIDKLLNDWGYAGDTSKAKAYAGWVNPEEFLDATIPPAERKSLESEATPLDVDKLAELDPMKLELVERDGVLRLDNHEGRHRLMALRNAGYNRVPVWVQFNHGAGASNSTERTGDYVPAQQWSEDLRAARGFFLGRLVPISYDNEQELKRTFGRGNIKFGMNEAIGEQASNIVRELNMGVTQEPTSREQATAALRSAISNPSDTAKAAKTAFTHFRDMLETKVFDTSAGVQNAIRRALRAEFKDQEQITGKLLAISNGATSTADAVAGQVLLSGAATYDAPNYKWKAEASDHNFVALSQKIDAMAEKYGKDKLEMEKIIHTAMVANRLAGLRADNAKLQAKADSLKALGKKAEAAKQKAKIKTIHMEDDEIELAQRLMKIMPEMKDVYTIWAGIRENTAKILTDSGLWSEEDASKMLDKIDYVPFYRIAQLENNAGPSEYLRGLITRRKGPTMKGSTQPVNDVFDNMARWVQYSVVTAIKNHGAAQLMKALVDANMARKIAGAKLDQSRRDLNIVPIWENGEKIEYAVDDPLFMSAFNGMEGVAIPALKWFSKVADVLRQSVVLYPMFSIAQVPQDAFGAMFISGLRFDKALSIPFRAVKEFAKTLQGTSETHKLLKQYGITGVRDVTSTLARTNAEIYAGLKAPPGFVGKLKSTLHHIAMASDNAVRQAVYEAAIAQGLTRAEALEKAVQVINFRVGGSSRSLAVAGQVIPFFKAYLAANHAAYKVLSGRGISPMDRKQALNTLATTMAGTMVMSLIYAMMMGDDDDYKKVRPEVRDRMLMIPGTGAGIPLRSDLFLLPKVVTEHMYHMITGDGLSDGSKFRDAMTKAMLDAILSPTAVPQAVKPFVEIGINHDFRQGRPLIGTFDQNKEKFQQFDEYTSELGKWIGQSNLVSPIAVDHVIRGMLGSVGGLVLYASNRLLDNPVLDTESDSQRADVEWRDAIATIPGFSNWTTKSTESAIKNDFYKLREQVRRVSTTVKDMENRTPYKLEEYMADERNQVLYGLRDDVESIGRKINEIDRNIAAVANASSEDLSDDEKRQLITEMQQAKEEMLQASGVREMREAAGM